jgi:hypothetical protein
MIFERGIDFVFVVGGKCHETLLTPENQRKYQKKLLE